jgi:hypothetical protein
VGKYSNRLPFSSGETPVVKFDDSDWQRIEAACGWTLSTGLRKDIGRVTEEFLTVEGSERTAATPADVKVVLEAYDKAASRFFSAVFADPSGLSDAGVFAQHLIERNSREVGKGSANIFESMLALLRAFHIACNASLKRLNDPQNSPFKPGSAWRLWVSRLTELIEAAELRSSVRNAGNKSKTDAQSAFARFVWYLQLLLPEECRRHTASEAACADAIRDVQAKEARKSLSENKG